MAVKRVGAMSFVEALVPEAAGRNGPLERLPGAVKRYRFAKLMAHLRRETSRGEAGYPVEVLSRGFLLWAPYGLSERAWSRLLATG